MQKKLIIAIVVSGILCGGMGYTLGKKFETNSLTATQGQNPGTRNFGGNTGGRTSRGGGMIGGEIISKDATSITVQLRGTQNDGSVGSKIIFLSDGTQVTKSAQGSTSDLSIGSQVSVFGTVNTDGSVIAQSVQIRPTIPEGGKGTSSPQ